MNPAAPVITIIFLKYKCAKVNQNLTEKAQPKRLLKDNKFIFAKIKKEKL